MTFAAVAVGFEVIDACKKLLWSVHVEALEKVVMRSQNEGEPKKPTRKKAFALQNQK